MMKNSGGNSFPGDTVIIIEILLESPVETEAIHLFVPDFARRTSESKFTATSSPLNIARSRNWQEFLSVKFNLNHALILDVGTRVKSRHLYNTPIRQILLHATYQKLRFLKGRHSRLLFDGFQQQFCQTSLLVKMIHVSFRFHLCKSRQGHRKFALFAQEIKTQLLRLCRTMLAKFSLRTQY
ncbi:MAG: hypothetical protein EZS28_005531 [Streblomastix strix]|uniref:Uncharacterized protein n=1 Tax=Streblomastix strix TaxID=222440 RepID=A0A5J4WVH3_9EUKA|nr:MAG: hypothetical protein EZS28_005531 [Streblomastix strix]